MDPTTLEIIATTLFGLAILHTFTVKRFEHIAHRYPNGSIGENFFHVLAEVEIVELALCARERRERGASMGQK